MADYFLLLSKQGHRPKGQWPLVHWTKAEFGTVQKAKIHAAFLDR
jgi:hypothetical protein